MTETTIVKITPRARRLAGEKGINLAELKLTGTGYQGGICEQDVIAFLASCRKKTTPLARKLAALDGLSLEDIKGSGVHGRVMKADVQAISKTEEKEVDASITGSASKGNFPSEGADRSNLQIISDDGDDCKEQFTSDGKQILDVLPYGGVRKIIGDRLSQSKFTAPHLYFTQKVNLEQLLELRKQINGEQSQKTSVTDYIARAVILSLQKYPDMNSSLMGDRIERYSSVNLGIAVAAKAGLIVPVIKNAQRKSLIELSADTAAFIEKARNGQLRPDEYRGGTFTISNLGMFGIENFTAIINPPEVGILSVSATKDEPCVVTGINGEKTIAIKPLMNITLSTDHRVIDGLLAAQFVTEIKRLLEHPLALII